MRGGRCRGSMVVVVELVRDCLVPPPTVAMQTRRQPFAPVGHRGVRWWCPCDSQRSTLSVGIGTVVRPEASGTPTPLASGPWGRPPSSAGVVPLLRGARLCRCVGAGQRALWTSGRVVHREVTGLSSSCPRARRRTLRSARPRDGPRSRSPALIRGPSHRCRAAVGLLRGRRCGAEFGVRASETQRRLKVSAQHRRWGATLLILDFASGSAGRVGG